MTRAGGSIAGNAFALLERKLIALQVALAAVVFVTFSIWLRLPDSSAVSLAVTLLVGLLLLIAAGAGQAGILLRLCGMPRTFPRVVRGAVLLLIAAACWIVWSALLGHLSSNDSSLAGYWNSRFPSSLRNVFSYTHIYRWLEALWTALEWLGAGILTVVSGSLASSLQPRKAISFALRSTTFWIALLCVGFGASFVTQALMNWTPGHGLAVEMVSLAVRVCVVVLVDAVLLVSGLAVLAACIRQSDSLHQTPFGGPDASQLRTAGTP